MGNEIRICPWRTPFLISKVSHDKYIVRAILPDIIHGILHSREELFSGRITLHKIINIVSVLILEILWSGSDHRGRCRNADKADLLPAGFTDRPRVEHQLPFLAEVTADEWKLSLFHILIELIHPIVKVMIARDDHIISHFIHQIDDCFSFGCHPDHFPLGEVSVIHQQRISSIFLKGILNLLQAHIPEVLLYAAMHITGHHDHDVFLRKLRLRLRAISAQRHPQSHDSGSACHARKVVPDALVPIVSSTMIKLRFFHTSYPSFSCFQ